MPKRVIKVLTRKHGVRDENELFRLEGSGMYPHSIVRTPELREEADQLLKEEEMKKKKKSYKKAISKKMMTNY